ncbi:hypothetical protein LDENG_00292090, partial [Lucifuga dentata]
SLNTHLVCDDGLLSQACFSYQEVGKTFLIQCSSSMLWEMIVSNITCMKIEYNRLKHVK